MPLEVRSRRAGRWNIYVYSPLIHLLHFRIVSGSWGWEGDYLHGLNHWEGAHLQGILERFLGETPRAGKGLTCRLLLVEWRKTLL